MPRSTHTHTARKLTELLVEARQAAGLTQVELAEHLDRPQSFVSKYENGERRLDVVEFLEVMDATGTDPAKLIRLLRKA